MENKEIVFWDVDTQKDFIDPHGKLYVPSSENLKENLDMLTQFAKLSNIRILGSVDFHSDTDPEIEKDNPNFIDTFPPHCMKGDPGQEKIMETRSDITQWIDPITYSKEKIEEIIEGKGPIIFRKTQLDVFSNPNLLPIIDHLKPKRIVIYGVATDFCVKTAIEGFLKKRPEVELYLVKDAIKGIDEGKSKNLVSEWISSGLKTLSTEEILKGQIFH